MRGITGSIFAAPREFALVNPVNTAGVMGAGLAREFKRRYPEMFREYAALCANERLAVGKLFFYRAPDARVIVNLPTKQHWRQPSRLEFVETGLRLFATYYAAFEITAVAFPRLGCGLGGLNWENQVKPLMERYLDPLPIRVAVYHLR
jgi:O-acetyl-ADP-ribose deacetylase (regulator of RNase III)